MRTIIEFQVNNILIDLMFYTFYYFPQVKENSNFSFGDRLIISLSIMASSCIYLVAKDKIFFLSEYYPSCVCVCVCLYVYTTLPLFCYEASIWVDSISWLLWSELQNGSACNFLIEWFHLIWINSQEWNACILC